MFTSLKSTQAVIAFDIDHPSRRHAVKTMRVAKADHHYNERQYDWLSIHVVNGYSFKTTRS